MHQVESAGVDRRIHARARASRAVVQSSSFCIPRRAGTPGSTCVCPCPSLCSTDPATLQGAVLSDAPYQRIVFVAGCAPEHCVQARVEAPFFDSAQRSKQQPGGLETG